MTARRAAAALAAATALVAGLLGVPAPPATAAPSSSGAAASGVDAQLTVAPRNAGVLRPGRPLDVDVEVRNTGTAPLPAGTLAFSLDQAPVASTAQLLTGEASVTRPSSELVGRLTLTSVDTPAVPPAATARVRARITADDLDSILTAASGARLLYVRLRAGEPGGDGLQAVAESAVVRMASDAPRVGFGTVIPLAAPAGTTGVVDVAAQAALTAEDGAWTQAVRAARAMPSAVLALDPAVVASVRLAGDGAPESARRLLADLSSLRNETARLPYADADTTLQRAAGLTGSTDPASFAGVTTASPGGSATPSPAPTAAAPVPAADATEWDWTGGRLSWPVPGTATAADLAGLRAQGPVLLGAADLKDTAGRIAAGPHATVRGTPVLVADAAASRLLATAAEGGITGDAALAPLVAALATTAVTRASPSLLAVAGRGASPAGLDRVLGRLQGLRWVRGETLRSMTARPATAVELQQRGVPAERAAVARTLVQGERAVQRLATAVPDPDSLAAPQRLALLGLLSAQWRGQDRTWTAAAAATTAGFDALGGSVTVVDPGARTFTGVDGNLTVSIRNDLPQAVEVQVTASASNGRLQFTGSRPTRVTVPANGVGTAGLAFRTVANGPTLITLGLETADGAAIGSGVSRSVSIQAGADTIVAVVLLTLLGLLLALGVYRNVTHRRRRRAER